MISSMRQIYSTSHRFSHHRRGRQHQETLFYHIPAAQWGAGGHQAHLSGPSAAMREKMNDIFIIASEIEDSSYIIGLVMLMPWWKNVQQWLFHNPWFKWLHVVGRPILFVCIQFNSFHDGEYMKYQILNSQCTRYQSSKNAFQKNIPNSFTNRAIDGEDIVPYELPDWFLKVHKLRKPWPSIRNPFNNLHDCMKCLREVLAHCSPY